MPFDSTLPDRLSAQFPIRNTDRDRLYLSSYQTYLRYFRERLSTDRIAENDAKVGVFLVYTWMSPARLNPSSFENFNRARSAIIDAQKARLDEQRVEVLKSFVGGSLIATSKFLHLLNPGLYAIWDRRVAWAGYRYQHHYQYNQTEKYVEYLKDLDDITLPGALAHRISAQLGEITDLRAKEFALFHLGIFEQSDEDSGG